MSSEDNDIVVTVLLCFFSALLTALIISILDNSNDNHLDNEIIKKDRNNCVLRRYQTAREYVDICAPAFRSVDD